MIYRDETLKWVHVVEFDVRDYELDCEGIVNNANYIHYLEHARHAFCSEAGLSFGDMVRDGVSPVVARIEIDYRTSLVSGDVARCTLWIERRGPRFIFHQHIYNKLTGTLAVKAVVTVACVVDGQLSRGDIMAEAYAKYIN